MHFKTIIFILVLFTVKFFSRKTDCSYKEILDIFRKPSIDYVKYEWYELALSLDLLDLSKEISQDLRLNKISYTEVIHFLLKNWRLRYSDNATLGKLLKLIPVEWKQLKGNLSTKTL